MATGLDLADIQGNIVRGYGQLTFPRARFFFLHIDAGHAETGRSLVDALRRKVTTAVRWDINPVDAGNPANPRPDVTLNIGFSSYGLHALGLPTRTLQGMPPEFIEGMAKRSQILGDVGPSGPEHWDPIWLAANVDLRRRAHIWIAMHGRPTSSDGRFEALEQQTQWLLELIETTEGVSLLSGHGPDGADYQDAAVRYEPDADGAPMLSAKEHFGFTDGISDPVFDGQFALSSERTRALGRGKLTPDQEWAPLATGEFLLGYADEAQELPPAAPPVEFTRNGTFLVYRKLHQKVSIFQDYIARKSERYAKVINVPVDEAMETLRAKMVGRWSNGIPLLKAPTYADLQKLNDDWKDIPGIKSKQAKGQALTDAEQTRLSDYSRMLVDFKFGNDIDGTRCPVSAHIRRANTRDMLDPMINSNDSSGLNGSALNKRRRMLRRGMPYGTYDPESGSGEGEHGLIFMAFCASLFRQFEFVQQQWINHGLDFNVGNDTCPVVGNREKNAKFVIASDPASGNPPFVCDQLPQFVTTRGGEYFFIPSVSALRMIASGIVDPT